MSDSDTIDVINALNSSLGEVSMHATADEIVVAGRTRRRRRRLAGAAAGIAGVSALGLVAAFSQPSTAPAPSAGGGGTVAGAQVHIHEAAFAVDTQSDGSLKVTWDKQRFITDHAGLVAALRQAGMPVTTREGEFCAAPGDNPTPGPAGDDPAVDLVLKSQSDAPDKVTFVFTPSAMPAGKQLFIGYLTPAQLEITQGRPGAILRLVPASGPLACTTTVPPSLPRPAPSGDSTDRADKPGPSGAPGKAVASAAQR
jgi:hypothetical protein